MAYTKTTWVNTVTPVNATNMNKIEGGIKDLDDSLNSLKGRIEQTLTDSTTNIPTSGAVKKYIDDRHNYSTEEIVIGTWIDGKPLYRKVVNYGQLPNNENKGILHNIPVDTPVSCKGIVYRTSGTINSWTIPTENIATDLDKNYVYVSTTSDRSSLTCDLIIEYTKTTD